MPKTSSMFNIANSPAMFQDAIFFIYSYTSITIHYQNVLSSDFKKCKIFEKHKPDQVIDVCTL